MSRTFSCGLVMFGAGLLLGSASRAWSGVALLVPPAQRGVVAHGAQGYLGIDVRDVSEEQVAVLRLRDVHGAEIIRVDHDGPAGKMGLREHDVVLQMNGVAVEGEEPIRRMLREMMPGRTVVLLISRDGQTMTVSAPMGDRGEVERQAWEQHLGVPQAPASALPSGEGFSAGGGVASATAASAAGSSGAGSSGAGSSGAGSSSRYAKGFLGTLMMSPSYTGARLEMMGPQLAEFFGVPGGMGLLVRSVANNSPAAMAGMRAGDVVVRLNAETVTSPGDWAKTMKEAKGRPITVVVLRDRQEKTLTLRPDGKRRTSLELPPLPFYGCGASALLEL